VTEIDVHPLPRDDTLDYLSQSLPWILLAGPNVAL